MPHRRQDARQGARPGRSASLYLLSPASLILIAWVFMLAGVAYGYATRDRLPVLMRTMDLNGIGFEFPVAGIVWTAICLLAVLVFGFAATRPIPRRAEVIGHPDDLSLALSIAGIAHVVIVLVVIAWVVTGAMAVGGFDRLMAMAATPETYVAREAILDNKLFPGMRMLYTGLIALGVFGACVFAANLRSPEPIRRDMAIGLAMFLVSAITLSVLPIFVSQRILLVQMVLSTFVGVSLVTGRLFHLKYVILLSALLFFVWSMGEAVTIGPWAKDNHSAARIGAEKLIYYLVNDFYNSVTPFSMPFENTYGVYSFTFLLYFTGLRGPVTDALADRMAVLEQLRAGGVFPAFTAPYVDFSWMGILLVIALVLLFTWVFNRTHRSFAFAVVYAQIGGAMLLTPHVAWYSHHNFTFNILLSLIVCAFIRPRTDPLAAAGLRGRTA